MIYPGSCSQCYVPWSASVCGCTVAITGIRYWKVILQVLSDITSVHDPSKYYVTTFFLVSQCKISCAKTRKDKTKPSKRNDSIQQNDRAKLNVNRCIHSYLPIDIAATAIHYFVLIQTNYIQDSACILLSDEVFSFGGFVVMVLFRCFGFQYMPCKMVSRTMVFYLSDLF